MKKKVSKELETLERRIKNLKGGMDSNKGNPDYPWEKKIVSSKAFKEFRIKDSNGFPKDSV